MRWFIAVLWLCLTMSTGVVAQTNESKLSQVKDLQMQTLIAGLMVRAPLLTGDTPTEDLESVISYIKAVSYLVEANDIKKSKQSLNKAFNYLAKIDDAKLMEEVEKMRSSKRELKVLQVALRETGKAALSNVINDYKTGGRTIKDAMRNGTEKLSMLQFKAKSKEKKQHLDKMAEMLAKHSKQDMANKVVGESLSPFTDGGRNKNFLGGGYITSVLKISDDYEWSQPTTTHPIRAVTEQSERHKQRK